MTTRRKKKSWSCLSAFQIDEIWVPMEAPVLSHVTWSFFFCLFLFVRFCPFISEENLFFKNSLTFVSFPPCNIIDIITDCKFLINFERIKFVF